ncbi:hypothetical protein BRADI_3g18510v3 [Brachypodium distachyon]|uniref:Uncharacterized protein n=1 Tax=Brachypodium distachyon TaxID=15368 RepID=I1I249_BRADI|nr:hypothetical protein BRADI_3g18510v3 [Brachypodium distachyon]
MTNLALLKQTDLALLTCFVIDQLGPADRLSVATSSSRASRLAKLVRMSDTGKAKDKAAVESLIAGGSTRIGEGLRLAADEARVAVRCPHRGVRLQEIKSGGLRLPQQRARRPMCRLNRRRRTLQGRGEALLGHASAPGATIKRLFELADMPSPCMDEERERVRLAATEDIARAALGA